MKKGSGQKIASRSLAIFCPLTCDFLSTHLRFFVQKVRFFVQAPSEKAAYRLAFSGVENYIRVFKTL